MLRRPESEASNTSKALPLAEILCAKIRNNEVKCFLQKACQYVLLGAFFIKVCDINRIYLFSPVFFRNCMPDNQSCLIRHVLFSGINGVVLLALW